METIKSFKARKLEELTENESISSFTAWKQNVMFHLASCESFAPFIGRNVVWGTSSVENRGLQDDTVGGKSAEVKAVLLEHMIGLRQLDTALRQSDWKLKESALLSNGFSIE